jgi:lysophospholipase L1-like esterase
MAPGRNNKSAKGASLARRHLRENLLQLLAGVRGDSDYARIRRLAELANISPSQLQRILVDPDDPDARTASLGTSIDIVERLATALQIRSADLLTPGYGEAAAGRPAQGTHARGEGSLRGSARDLSDRDAPDPGFRAGTRASGGRRR